MAARLPQNGIRRRLRNEPRSVHFKALPPVLQSLILGKRLSHRRRLLRGKIDSFVRLYLLLSGSLKLQSGGKNLVDEDESDIQDAVMFIDSYLAPFSAYKYFCCDDAGRFAWVPSRAKTGDLFCIFHGAAVPHLLRSVRGGQSELIGPCFLQGCMDGEVFEGDDFMTKEFIIV